MGLFFFTLNKILKVITSCTELTMFYYVLWVIYQLIIDRFLKTLHHFEEEQEPFKMAIKTTGFFQFLKSFIRITNNYPDKSVIRKSSFCFRPIPKFFLGLLGPNK